MARKAKNKAATFSVVKAVKANARARLGSPPAERILPNTREQDRPQPKHKPSLADLVARKEEDPS